MACTKKRCGGRVKKTYGGPLRDNSQVMKKGGKVSGKAKMRQGGGLGGRLKLPKGK